MALNCNAELNDKEGNEAKNWRKGKPVRVLRKGNADEKSLAKGPSKGKGKAGKHTSSYGPEMGVRYGILISSVLILFLIRHLIIIYLFVFLRNRQCYT